MSQSQRYRIVLMHKDTLHFGEEFGHDEYDEYFELLTHLDSLKGLRLKDAQGDWLFVSHGILQESIVKIEKVNDVTGS